MLILPHNVDVLRGGPSFFLKGSRSGVNTGPSPEQTNRDSNRVESRSESSGTPAVDKNSTPGDNVCADQVPAADQADNIGVLLCI